MTLDRTEFERYMAASRLPCSENQKEGTHVIIVRGEGQRIGHCEHCGRAAAEILQETQEGTHQ